MFSNIVKQLKESFELFYNVLMSDTYSNYYDEFNNDLQSRMKNLEYKFNNRTSHPFKPHVFSLKSKKLLSYINSLGDNLQNKMELLRVYNNVLNNVASKLYDKCDPTLIFMFNNEIHLLHYYNEDGEYQYDGNINKMLSKITSYASIVMNEELKKNNIDLDFTFECTYVEFDIDYECLNYLVWRQLDCKRNLITLLYKCHKNDKSLDLRGMKLNELQNELDNTYPELQQEMSDLFYGTIVKKEIVKNLGNSENSLDDKHISFCTKDGFEITKELNLVSERRKVVFEHFWLFENFTDVLELYVYNKFLNDEYSDSNSVLSHSNNHEESDTENNDN